MAAAQSAFGTAVKGFREESAARIVRIDVLLLRRGDRADGLLDLHARHGDRGRHRGQPVLLRAAAVDLRRRRDRADAARRPLRLLAAARAEARAVRRDARLDRARVPARRGRARLTPLDRAAVLPLPAVGARQGAPDPGPVGVRDRPDQAAAGPRDDQPDHAAGAHPGDHGRRAAGPRVRARVPRDRHRRSCSSPGRRGRISRRSAASRRPP